MSRLLFGSIIGCRASGRLLTWCALGVTRTGLVGLLARGAFRMAGPGFGVWLLARRELGLTRTLLRVALGESRRCENH